MCTLGKAMTVCPAKESWRRRRREENKGLRFRVEVVKVTKPARVWTRAE